MFRELLRTVRELWGERGLRPLLFSVTATLCVAVTFYRVFEGWSWLDSFYFTITTLTTIGYGDFAPTTPLTKVFTIFLVLSGVGFIMGFLRFVVSRTVRRRLQGSEGIRTGGPLPE